MPEPWSITLYSVPGGSGPRHVVLGFWIPPAISRYHPPTNLGCILYAWVDFDFVVRGLPRLYGSFSLRSETCPGNQTHVYALLTKATG